MVNLILFLTILVVSLIVVRIGAIAFQLTGISWDTAKFQALSCFTSTGFTTKESELITTSKQRRRIASALIILGHAGFVTMIATLVNSLGAQQAKEAIGDKLTSPWLPSVPDKFVPWVNLGIIILCIYLIYKIFTNTRIAYKLTQFLRNRILKQEIIKHVTFEELAIATGGYGVSKIRMCTDSLILNKTIMESGLKEMDIMILAIVSKEGETIPNPPPTRKIQLEDELICFGKLDNIRTRLCQAA